MIPTPKRKKKLIERAYLAGERLGLAVWNEDEAGPYQTCPQTGQSWQPRGQPLRSSQAYLRIGTAKLLTLLHSATGEVRVQGVTSTANAVLHPWMKRELSAILTTLPIPPTLENEGNPARNRACWEQWQEGLTKKFTLLKELPPLRMLLILDNLAGHKTPQFVCWLMEHGIMPLYTPLGGSWLNMAESVQRILVRRALSGQHPHSARDIIEWLEATARAWNRAPTPFVWGGARHARRERTRRKTTATKGTYGGSAAYWPRITGYRKAA